MTTESLDTRSTPSPLSQEERRALEEERKSAMSIKRNLGIENEMYKQMASENNLKAMGETEIDPG